MVSINKILNLILIFAIEFEICHVILIDIFIIFYLKFKIMKLKV